MRVVTRDTRSLDYGSCGSAVWIWGSGLVLVHVWSSGVWLSLGLSIGLGLRVKE